MEQNHTTHTPAYLWLGQHKYLAEKTIEFLQDIFCEKEKRCTTCSSCQLIAKKQYYAAQWLYPEKKYTLDAIDPIVKTIAFALEEQQQYFFIIQKADLLTPACQNKLLKSIEEPPPGYSFIFLAEHKESLLPTIQSRCLIKEYLNQEQETVHTELIAFFTGKKSLSPSMFLQMLDKAKLQEHESKKILDTLIRWYAQQQTKDETFLSFLKKGYEKPPMPGSSKLFWKNMYLQMPNHNR